MKRFYYWCVVLLLYIICGWWVVYKKFINAVKIISGKPCADVYDCMDISDGEDNRVWCFREFEKYVDLLGQFYD